MTEAPTSLQGGSETRGGMMGVGGGKGDSDASVASPKSHTELVAVLS